MARTLQAELKSARPFSSLEQEAMLNLARTAARLDHDMLDALRPHGLTPTQYNALRILRGAGAAGLCRNEVRDRLVSWVPDATRLLDRLEDTGLVVRGREGQDRRFVQARITRKGLKLLAQLDPVIAELHHHQLGHLGRNKLRALIGLLEDARDRG